MQNPFALLETDVIPIFMIIALDIIITSHFSINCSAVICSPTVLFSIWRESTSETYGPQVYFPSYKFYFPSYKFPIYNISFRSTILAIFYLPIYKPKIPKIFTLSFIYLYQISLSQLTVWIDNPFLALGASLFNCLCRYSMICALSPTGFIPWFSN